MTQVTPRKHPKHEKRESESYSHISNLGSARRWFRTTGWIGLQVAEGKLKWIGRDDWI